MNYDVLHNFISPVTGRIKSNVDYVPYGDRNEYATPSPILIDIRLDLIRLRKKVDTEVMRLDKEINTKAPYDATYILQQPHELLQNAQALNSLSGGILKSSTEGVVSIALGGKATTDDYITPLNLQEEINATRAFATSEALAAQAAAIAESTLRFNIQMAPYSLSPFTGVAITTAYTAAIATEAAIINTRIDNLKIKLVGDVLADDFLSNNVNTTYKENSEFKGDYIKVPKALILEETTTKPTELDCIFLHKVDTS